MGQSSVLAGSADDRFTLDKKMKPLKNFAIFLTKTSLTYLDVRGALKSNPILVN